MPVASKEPETQEDQSAETRRRRRRPILYSGEQLVIGIGGTILLHLWLLLLFWLGVFEVSFETSEDPYKNYSIVLDTPVPEEEEFVYTQTNPDVPTNEPDNTSKFGARSQQAANEEVPEELDPENMPATESEDNIETNQFLSGSLYDPIPAPPPASSESQETAQEQQEPSPNQPLLQAVTPSEQAQRKEIPIMGSQEDLDPDKEGIAEYDYDQLDESPTNVTDLIEGEAEEGEEEANETESPETVASTARPPQQPVNQSPDGLPAPRPRPQLPRVPSGPVRDSRIGVSNIGQVAVDAKASKFGEYMERLIETVKLNWDDLVQLSSAEERKSMVKLRFILTRDGEVKDVEILEGTTSRVIGRHMCIEAVKRGAPYGPWPEGLVEIFGDEEDITFNFHYY